MEIALPLTLKIQNKEHMLVGFENTKRLTYSSRRIGQEKVSRTSYFNMVTETSLYVGRST